AVAILHLHHPAMVLLLQCRRNVSTAPRKVQLVEKAFDVVSYPDSSFPFLGVVPHLEVFLRLHEVIADAKHEVSRLCTDLDRVSKRPNVEHIAQSRKCFKDRGKVCKSRYHPDTGLRDSPWPSLHLAGTAPSTALPDPGLDGPTGLE